MHNFYYTIYNNIFLIFRHSNIIYFFYFFRSKLC